MNNCNFEGVIIDEQIYLPRTITGMYLPVAVVPEHSYTDYGWLFPSDENYIMLQLLDTNNDLVRDEKLNYMGNFILPNGKLLRAKMCGTNYRVYEEYPHTRVKMIPNSQDSALVGGVIENLSMRPEIDPKKGEWTIERIEEILSHYATHCQFVKWKTVSEVVSELSSRTTKPFPLRPGT